MKHKFLAKITDKSICAFCSRLPEAHSIDALCESCANRGDCEIKNGILMCPECQSLEARSIIQNIPGPSNEAEGTSQSDSTNHSMSVDSTSVIENKVEPKEQLSIEQLANQVNRLLDTNQIQDISGNSVKTIIDSAIKGNINEFTDFFNAKIPSIIELEQAINADESITDKKYELARLLRARVQYLSKVLFQFNNKAVEMSGEVKAIQHYMGTLIPKLRADIRGEFALNNTEYKPIPIKEVKAPKIRLSPTDRIAEGIAKTMNIPLEQAKRIVLGGLKKTGIECTCSVTPGICKVHVS